MSARATRRSLPGLFTLAVRQLAAGRAVPFTLALVIALLAALGTAAPRILRDSEDRQAAYDVASSKPFARDVTAVVTSGELILFMVSDGSSRFSEKYMQWAGIDEGLIRLRESLGEPLRSILGDPIAVIMRDGPSADPDPETDFFRTQMNYVMSPALPELAELSEGHWPSAENVEAYFEYWGRQNFMDPEAKYGFTLEVAISKEASEVLRLDVGEEFRTAHGMFVVSGTYVPKDADGSEWLHLPNSVRPFIETDPNRGMSATFAGVVSPQIGDRMPSEYGPFAMAEGLRGEVWFPVKDFAPSSEELGVAASEITAFLSTTQAVGVQRDTPVRVQFSTALAEEFTGTLGRIEVVRTLLFVLALGPALIGIVVLVLGTRLVVERRRRALMQMTARGASRSQLSYSALGEGLALSIPPAAIGAAGAILLTKGGFRPLDLAAPIVLVIFTTILLVAATRSAAAGLGVSERADLGSGNGQTSNTRKRRIARFAEGAVAIVAGGILLLTVQQFLNPDTPPQGYLALAGPAAAIALAVIAVLRLYPAVVALLDSRATKGKGLARFIAFARARRAPSGGVTPVIGLVSGVSVAMLAALLTSTVTNGMEATQWRQAGGDVRVSGPPFSTEHLDAVLGIDGVEAAGRVATIRTASVEVDGEPVDTRVVIVDAAGIAQVQHSSTGIALIPADLTATDSEPLPAVALEASGITSSSNVTISGHPAQIVATGSTVGGLKGGENSVIVDASSAELVSSAPWRPNVLLIKLADEISPGSDQEAAVLEKIEEVLPSSLIETKFDMGTRFTGSPLGTTMAIFTWAALIVSGLLVAISLVLTQMLSAPSRIQVTSVLRTLGMKRKGARHLAALELAPTVGISVVVGAVVGWLVALLVVATTNLAPLTGGDVRPPLWADWSLLALVGGGIIAVAFGVVMVSAWAAGRADVARLLKVGEE